MTAAAWVQIGYGASIASFLGGIHWALAMANYGEKFFLMQGTDLSSEAQSACQPWTCMPCSIKIPALVIEKQDKPYNNLENRVNRGSIMMQWIRGVEFNALS